MRGGTSNLVALALRVGLLGILSLPACSVVDNSPDGTGVQGERASVSADADGDGVEDSLDRCENTEMPQPVNAAGCAIFAGKLDNVEFRPDSYSLNQPSRDSLDSLISQLNQYPDVVLSVAGHTDNRGNARDNLELSKKRVLAVVRYLVINGIDGRRLQPHGYGESRPSFNNSTVEGRARNRRIEITVVKNASS